MKRVITRSTRLHTVLTYVLWVVLALFLVPLLLLCALLPARVRYTFPVFLWLQSCMYWAVIKSTLVPVRVVGMGYITNQPAIIIANHQSYLDGMFIGLLMQRQPHIWLAKQSLTNVPLLGFLLRRLSVLVDTSSPQRAMRALVQAMKLVTEHHAHMMLFPEGTRFPDDQIHTFAGGFALMAKKLGRHVIPIKLFGAEKVLPAGSGWVQRHPVTIVVGQPFMIGDNETEQQFIDRVHAWFVQQNDVV